MRIRKKKRRIMTILKGELAQQTPPVTQGELQPFTLAQSSWQVPEIRPSDIFLISTAVGQSNAEKKAHFHIGNPPKSEPVINMQRQAIWADDSYKEMTTGLPKVEQKVFDWINTTVVNNVTAYGPDGGSKDIRQAISEQYGSIPENTTIVSGGHRVATDLISRVLQASIPKSDGPHAKLEEIHLIDPTGSDGDALEQIVEKIVQASKAGNFIHLVIHDSSKITSAELRTGLINLARIGKTIITDIVSGSEPVDSALSNDPTVGNLVLTLHNSPLANACGISAVMGDEKLVASIQGLHTQLYGSPSTTQTDLYTLLSNEDMAGQILALGNTDVESLKQKNEFFANLINFLKLTLKGDKNSLEMRDQDINTHLQELAHFIHNFYFPNTSMEMVITNGGGREGLKNLAEYAVAKKGIRRVAILSPHWTYNNVFKEPLEIVSIKNCFNKEGEVDLAELEGQLQSLSDSGKLTDLSLIVESGGRNPNGSVYDRKTKETILKICSQYGIPVWDDAAYFHMELKEEDRHSFVGIAKDMVERKELVADFEENIYTVFTFTKMPTMAGARLNATGSKDEEFIKWLKRVQTSEIPNNLGILLAHQLLSDPIALGEREIVLRDDVKARFTAAQEKLTAADIEFSPAGGAFYQTVTIPGLAKEDPKNLALSLADKGIGFVPMIIFGGESDQVRLALGGNRSPQQIGEQIQAFISCMEENGLLFP
jgi:aspartate/methionine/tyrosine aminotransferase